MPLVFFRPQQADGFREVILDDGETLLDGLLRHGFDVPHGCRSGVCQSCLLQCSGAGAATAAAQSGLKPRQVEQGLFLSCRCKPGDGFRAHHAEQETQQRYRARVLDLQVLSPQVLRLRIEAVGDCRPGQFMTLWKDARVARCYSIASLPARDNYLEFHIKYISNGLFSRWAWESLRVGDELQVQGPMGDCTYRAGEADQPLLLAAVGTGLAPIYGVLRDALTHGHRGPIALFVGGREPNSFYLLDKLASLARNNPNLSVHFVVQTGVELEPQTAGAPPGAALRCGDIYQTIHAALPSLSGYRVFLCGAESFVRKLKKQCFLAGASMGDIHADAFLALAP